MNYQKLFETKIPSQMFKERKKAGKKTIGVVCCHVPLELLHAADILPVRLRATGCEDYSQAEVWMSSFSCSFAKSILQYLMDGVYELDGIIASDGCMQAVRIYDNWKAISEKGKKTQLVYEIGVPRMRSKTTKEFYKNELIDLKQAMEEFSGNLITDEKLLASIELYNRQRELVQRVLELQKHDPPLLSGTQVQSIMLAATNMPPEEYIELLEELLADEKNLVPVTDGRARLMMIGSAMDNPAYTAAIEGKGGIVVADTLCLGRMGFGEEMKPDKADLIGSLADYYMDRLVCPRMIDNRDELHEFILNKAKEYKVDGVVYQKMQNCECWGGENVFLEGELKEIGIPLLNLEREQKLANLGQLEIRAEAFIEMIEKED